MSEMKHTPGPWICDGEEFVYALNDWGINRTYVLVQGGYTNMTTRARTQPEELQANARLIAAAPDLLEAAVAVVAARKDAMLNLADAMRELEVAVAKAGAA